MVWSQVSKMAEKKEVIIAIYKVNLHCPKCASKIKKPLLKTQGVQSVDVDVEKGEIKVKGAIEVEKILKQIKKWSKKKVELISKVEAKKTPEAKKEVIHTTVLKVYIHCAVCEKDLRKKLLKHKGIHEVKTDVKAQTLTVQGILEPAKLVTYIRKKVHKHAEIMSTKTNLDEEKKKKEEVEKKKKKKEEEEKEKEKEKLVVEFKEQVKVEVKDKDGTTPYFIHYVYAPQLFSDENPNACSIM